MTLSDILDQHWMYKNRTTLESLSEKYAVPLRRFGKVQTPAGTIARVECAFPGENSQDWIVWSTSPAAVGYNRPDSLVYFDDKDRVIWRPE